MTQSSLTSREVARRADIWHTQVSRYARRLGVERGKNGWPHDLVDRIIANRAHGDPREGIWCDDLRVTDGVLEIASIRVNGRRRIHAKVALTKANRSTIKSLMVE